jgi:geranylgeranylglycerol-phosphate geranylgeranyltransferase
MNARAWFDLLRPGNIVLGVVGVVAGGLAAHGSGIHAPGLLLAVVAVVLGIAGGNALNDVLDARIDTRAHPKRPIPRGALDAAPVGLASATALASAVGAAWAANPAAGAWATLLVAALALYEGMLKRRGLLGNLTVSFVVGGTFVLGALGAAPGGLDVAAHVWVVVLPMAVLAGLANAAREVYKDIQDMEADRAGRSSLPMVVGSSGARLVAGVFLGSASVLAISLFYTQPEFGDVYLVLVLPAVILFVLSLAANEAAVAARTVKVGMVPALFAFLAVGLL